jgi:hypothetical protein
MKTNFDRRKSLQDLESEDWGEPNYNSYLVQTCHRLRRVPLTEFTTEDLRIMIGQKISLLFLVPIALEQLEEDPLAEGKCCPGDLLSVVLSIPEPFWSTHWNMRDVLRKVVTQTKQLLLSLDETDLRLVRQALAKAPDILQE